MITELSNRLSNYLFVRTLEYDGVLHTICPIWFSDWLPFTNFTWLAQDEDGYTYDIQVTYTTEPVIITSSTPPLPTYQIRLFFPPPQVRIIHLSELSNIGQEIDKPTLIILADTNITTSQDSWIDHSVQVYYLIPIQRNLTAERKIEIHTRQTKHFKEWMENSFIFINRIEHRPFLTDNDERRIIAGDFFSLSATITFKEFRI